MSRDTLIRFDGVGFGYGTKASRSDGEVVRARPAVQDVSLEVRQGELVAIIGANGSGKSTLAKLANALLLPQEGVVVTVGLDTRGPENLLRIRESCGLVFQNPDAQSVATIVEDDVAFGPENLGLARDEIEARVTEALDTVHMLDMRKRSVYDLSGGQRQRVAIASVLAMHPDVIIFDEPTARLDPRAHRGIRRVIHELNDAGYTILLITHSMNEAVHTDRIIVMDKGRVALDGTPEEVFSHKEEIRAMGLSLPYSVILAEELRARGIPVSDTIHTEELKEELCRLYSSR